MVGTNYLELVEDLVHSKNRVKPAGAHTRTKGGLRRSVQQQGQLLIPDDGKAITARTDEHNTALVQYSKQHHPATEAVTAFSGEHDPRGGHSPSDRSNDRAGNPTITCDDNDDVRTKTTYRARQGVEPVNDKRR